MNLRPAVKNIRRSLDPLHAGFALVVVAATFPLFANLALPVVANHRERVKRAGIEPNPFLANRRAKIGCWLHVDNIHQVSAPSACAST
jgi:hypothetical protein